MAKRELMMLAHKYNPQKHNCGGWYISAKLDGSRAFWDGGVSRGLYCKDVPWANVEKDARLVDQPIASGLWSRYGKVIHCPQWWAAMLPRIPLDMELYAGPNSWQKLSKIVKRFDMSGDWECVKAMILDCPPFNKIFSNGHINTTNYKKYIHFDNIKEFIQKRSAELNMGNMFVDKHMSFEFVYERLIKADLENDVVQVHKQSPIPLRNYRQWLEQALETYVDQGFEGLMLRDPNSIWEPERSHSLLKYKPRFDDEAVVTGYIWGKETDKGSKLLGKIGALITNYNGQKFELAGLNDQERELIQINNDIPNEKLYEYYLANEGQEVDLTEWQSKIFPIGTVISFKYRELSDGGLPKEGAYWRKHS